MAIVTPTKIEYADARTLQPFPDHPFQVREDEELEVLVESIYLNGVTSPLLIWERKPGDLIILSGHRRNLSCILLGRSTGDESYLSVPVLIYRGITYDEAVLIMVDENAKREKLLPSEKGKAYRMKLEALKRKAGRPPKTASPTSSQIETKLWDGNSGPMVPNFRSDEEVARMVGENRKQVQRYIRLTYLKRDLADLVDSEHLGFRAGVEISYLKPEEQETLCEAIGTLAVFPTLKQARLLKAASKDKTLTPEKIRQILEEERMDDRVSFRVKPDQLEKLNELSMGSDTNRSEVLRALAVTGGKVYIGRDAVVEILDVRADVARVGNLLMMQQNRLDMIADNPWLVQSDREALQLAIEDTAKLRKELDALRKTMHRLCRRINKGTQALNAGETPPH